MFTVTLDACVLVPITLCDVILRIAQTGAFGVRWSPTILEETERTMIHKLSVPEQAAGQRIAAMHKAFPFAQVHDYEALEPLLTNHPKDRHVLACAIKAQVHTIVTFNLKDFPPSALEAWDVEAVHPDEFLLNQLDLAPGHVTAAFTAMLSSYRRRSWERLLAVPSQLRGRTSTASTGPLNNADRCRRTSRRLPSFKFE